jgi:hypothetical protein
MMATEGACDMSFPKALLWTIFVAAIAFGLPRLTHGQKAPRITGTYTDMYYNREGGDVLGEEIRIVYTSRGYQGALQFAEGVPEALVVVDVKVDGSRISFTIPEDSPSGGQFSGAIENGVLKGEFRFKAGGSEKVSLRRGKSYWD